MSQLGHFHTVTSSEANDIITELNPIILDVRTPQEFNEGYIEGAINLPMEDINESSVFDIASMNTPVLVYCRSGSRSTLACEMLAEIGTKDLFNLADGITGWPFGVVR